MLTRRRLMHAGAGALGAGLAASSYAVVIEPGLRLVVQEHRVTIPGWDRPPLVVCAIADVHAGDPWMPLSRVERIVTLANALAPDLHVVLGDLPAHYRLVARRIPAPEVVAVLAGLKAPLGCVAILGNHDWWDDPAASLLRRPAAERAWRAAGVPVLANRAIRVPHGAGLWLAGTDSALAFGRRRPGADDLAAALAPLAADDAPALLLIHEPDLFVDVPPRVALTLAGHTHGGQIRLFGYSPIVPSRYGRRFAYGMVQEDGRQMVVSGGLGCSIAPVRFGVPPELTLVRVS